MSITRGVLAQSPEPEAHDKVLDNNPGPHWWEACVGGKCSTTAPSQLPIKWVGFLSKEKFSIGGWGWGGGGEG